MSTSVARPQSEAEEGAWAEGERDCAAQRAESVGVVMAAMVRLGESQWRVQGRVPRVARRRGARAASKGWEGGVRRRSRVEPERVEVRGPAWKSTEAARASAASCAGRQVALAAPTVLQGRGGEVEVPLMYGLQSVLVKA